MAFNRGAFGRSLAGEVISCGGEKAQCLVNNGVEVRELVDLRIRSVLRQGSLELVLQLPLDSQLRGLRDVPHQKAEGIARRFDAGKEMVGALGVDLTAGKLGAPFEFCCDSEIGQIC